jgi:hypothetical protein
MTDAALLCYAAFCDTVLRPAPCATTCRTKCITGVLMMTSTGSAAQLPACCCTVGCTVDRPRLLCCKLYISLHLASKLACAVTVTLHMGLHVYASFAAVGRHAAFWVVESGSRCTRCIASKCVAYPGVISVGGSMVFEV